MPPVSPAPTMGPLKRRPVPKPPKMLPRTKPVDRKVYLASERWDELMEAASFQTAAFKAAGSTESVSRNDIVDFLLGWALEAFWEGKGGKPAVDTAEWRAKVEAEAARIKKELEARKAKAD